MGVKGAYVAEVPVLLNTLQACQIQPVMTSDLLIAQIRVRADKRRSLMELAAGHPCVITLQRSDN